jgi:phosphate:Na+ symporter
MIFDDLDIWKFLAGLGIFMFGMFLLEESIKLLSGKTFKRFIRKSTTGRLRSIFTGMTSTAILQSSSAVSLMTLAFVGAGIMTMQNAIGVIMGTNLGTTFTGWIVATLGFKLNIEGIALPLIGIGGLGLIFFSKSPRYSGFSKLFVGLGFLFMGLDYMKVALEDFAETIDLATLPHFGTWFYVLLGFFLTGLMQSSSATIAIVLTALNSGIIFFDEGAAMVIGANVGTTVTVLLGVIGGVALKKQVAFSHVIFNVGTGIVALLFLPFFIKLILWMHPEGSDNVIDIALFHTLFNLLGVILFFPFIPRVVTLLRKWFPEQEAEVTRYLNNVSFDLPEAGIRALHQETGHLTEKSLKFAESLLFDGKVDNKSAAQRFEEIRTLQSAISVYGSNIRHGDLDPEEKGEIHRIISVSLQISQITKTLWGMHSEIDELSNSSTPAASSLFGEIRTTHLQLWKSLRNLLEHAETTELALSNLQAEIESQYHRFINLVAELLNKGEIEQKHASWLMLVNGLLTQCNRQYVHACGEWKTLLVPSVKAE